MKRLVYIWLLLIFTISLFGQSESIRVATYNLLRFPYNNGTGRMASFRAVVQAMNPDVLVVQELQSEQGCIMFLDSVMNAEQPLYAAAPYVDGRDTDNMLYYKTDRLKLIQSESIQTYLRNIGKYTLTHTEGSDTFRIYVVHLKAGTEADDRERRQWDAALLRGKLNSLASGSYFLVAGDFNVYNGTEPAFVVLTESQDDNDGQCFDPVDHVGKWHDNAAFAYWHTQSTRTTLIDSGATGGLDDRFDFILCSKPFLEPGGLSVIQDSYAAFGNDGLHFNSSIQAGGNRMVRDEVAEALYYASDHLPVYMDFTVEMKDTLSSVSFYDQFPRHLHLYQNYPNPFNGQTRIAYEQFQRGDVRLSVYDIHGKRLICLLFPGQEAGYHTCLLNMDNFASGVYLYRVQVNDNVVGKKLILLK